MSPKPISPLLKAWYNWKTLRLPWRKRFLIGLDLQGNTFWEFRDVRGDGGPAARWRRIVQYPRSAHYADVKVSPQWHSWLRHARRDPPSLDEQSAELARQEQMKHLAAAADARWAAKPRLTDAPGGPTGQRVPALETERPAVPRGEEAGRGAQGPRDAAPAAADGTAPAEDKSEGDNNSAPDPWKQARGGPSEEWQPQAWTPTSKR